MRTPELLPVVQADRDLREWILRRDGDLMHLTFTLDRLLARHRIEHTTPDRNAVLEEADHQRIKKQFGLALEGLSAITDVEVPHSANDAFALRLQATAQQALDDIARVGIEAIALQQMDPVTETRRRYGAAARLLWGNDERWPSNWRKLLGALVADNTLTTTPEPTDQNAVLEEAAKVADAMAHSAPSNATRNFGHKIAGAIRARKKPTP